MSLEMSPSASPIAQFDDVVIGSSPLMLLQAGLLARAGRRVCLLERAARLGGSWQTARLETGEEVEIACHVIEVFPKVYRLLEAASGVAFVALDAQPIRIHPTGFRAPYFSRVLLVASGARLGAGWARTRLALAMGRSTDRNRMINFQTKLTSYLRHQLPAFFQRPIMQGPKHGFVDFMDRLVARTRADGVEMRTMDVTGLSRTTGMWQISDAEGGHLLADHVHCTTSTNLRPVAPGKLEAAPQTFANRMGIVVDVAHEDLHTNQTYVAFWKDPTVARISRVDATEPGPHTRFLVEFNSTPPDAQIGWTDIDWTGAVRGHMERARIVVPGGAFRVVGQVDCLFTTNVDQLPAGRIDTNLWGYYSMGNLAAGIAAWQKSNRIPPLTASGTGTRTGPASVSVAKDQTP